MTKGEDHRVAGYRHRRGSLAKSNARVDENTLEELHTIIFTDVINKRYLVQGLKNASFDIEGARSFKTFGESRMDIVFVTRRHGTRVLEAFRGGLTMPGVSKRVIATSRYPINCDDNYGSPCVNQVTTEPTFVTKQDGRDTSDASAKTVAQERSTNGGKQLATWMDNEVRHVLSRREVGNRKCTPEPPTTGRKQATTCVEDGVHFSLSREYVGKRKRGKDDKTDVEDLGGEGEKGHKKRCPSHSDVEAGLDLSADSGGKLVRRGTFGEAW